MANPDRLTYKAGAAGAITVPVGCYVSGLSCHATGSGATLTLAPQGEDTDAGVAGDAIPIPAGVGFALGAPVLRGDVDELGAGSVLTFTGTDSYVVVLRKAH